MRADLDYLDHLGRESARFAAAIELASPTAPVPTCPDWTADDLLWHLARVQWWWATIVSAGVTGPEAEKLQPERPADRIDLQRFFQQASANLRQTLAEAPPETPAWTWSDDHTVGFIRRKQAHEALIHRVDAELTTGSRTAMDPALSADGVDEVLRVMYSGVPEWGNFAPDPVRTLRMTATDTGDSWFITLGRFTGTDPGGTSYDESDFDIAATDDGTSAAAMISGRAADLDCWLWHRPSSGPLARSGDPVTLGAFDEAIAPALD